MCLGFVHIPDIGKMPFQTIEQKSVQRCDTHIETQSCKASYILLYSMEYLACRILYMYICLASSKCWFSCANLNQGVKLLQQQQQQDLLLCPRCSPSVGDVAPLLATLLPGAAAANQSLAHNRNHPSCQSWPKKLSTPSLFTEDLEDHNQKG